MKTKKIIKAKSKAPLITVDSPNISDELLNKIKEIKFVPKFETSDGALNPKGDQAAFDRYVGLCKSTGAVSTDLQNHFIRQLYALKGGSSDSHLNAALAFLHSMKPTDEMETMLAAQMFVAHDMTMNTAANVNRCEDMEMNDRYVNRFAKLTNVFRDNLEALNKHRGKGQQKVTVEHVHVHSGGQAIVGTVEGGGVHGKK